MRRSVGSMIAVMTMNIGYFLSVLGGIFLGAFVAGRVGTSAYHH
jgi:solute carrier family 31 (copper transporter), member 1